MQAGPDPLTAAIVSSGTVCRYPFGYYTARGFGNDPKLKVLRGNAAFERLIRDGR